MGALFNFIMRVFALMRGRAVVATATRAAGTGLVLRSAQSAAAPIIATVVPVAAQVSSRAWPAMVARVLRYALVEGTLSALIYGAMSLFFGGSGESPESARQRVDSALTAAGIDPATPLMGITDAQLDSALDALRRAMGADSPMAGAVLDGMRSNNPNLSISNLLAEEEAVSEFTSVEYAVKRLADLFDISPGQVYEAAAHLEVLFNAEPDDIARAARHGQRMGRA